MTEFENFILKQTTATKCNIFIIIRNNFIVKVIIDIIVHMKYRLIVAKHLRKSEKNNIFFAHK